MSASEIVGDPRDVVVGDRALVDNEEDAELQENIAVQPLPEALPVSKMRKGITRASRILVFPWILSTILVFGAVSVNVFTPKGRARVAGGGTAEHVPRILNAGFWCGFPLAGLSIGLFIYHWFIMRSLKRDVRAMLNKNGFYTLGLVLSILYTVMVGICFWSFKLLNAAVTPYLDMTFHSGTCVENIANRTCSCASAYFLNVYSCESLETTQRSMYTALQWLLALSGVASVAVAISLCFFQVASTRAFCKCKAELRSNARVNCHWRPENPSPPSYEESVHNTQPVDVLEQPIQVTVCPARSQPISIPVMTPVQAPPPPYHSQITTACEFPDGLPTYHQVMSDIEYCRRRGTVDFYISI